MNSQEEILNNDDDLNFIDESADEKEDKEKLTPWKIIVADDNEEVHSVTKLVLDGYYFKGRNLKFFDAYTGEQTKQLIEQHPDVAFILLDVVMETDHAGLEVVRHIRENLKNDIVQIVLNTGQPGQAPEQEVIAKYDINDYKSKTEFNAKKLITTVTASLRAFSLSSSLNLANSELNNYKNHLEELVKKRTIELKEANDKLAQEVEERKHAQKALQKSNELLGNILAASPIGICLVEKRSIKWMNEEMQKLFGFENEKDYKGKNIEIIYQSEKECYRVGKSILDKLNGEERVAVDTTLMRKDGSLFPGNLRISSTDPSDPMEKSIITVSDITWRKEAEHDRVQKERLQGALEMSGSICHELNQPLQYVSGSSELLIMDMSKDDPIYNTICKMRDQIKRMGKITKKLMSITRYETCEYAGGKFIIDLDKASSEIDDN
jgi:PAS domain S-box-containing protein